VSLPVFSPDGRWVAVRLIDDTVHVLDTRSGQPAFSLKGRPYAFKDSVSGYGRDMDFSPDSTRLAVTRPEGGVTFHRLPNGELTSDWAGPEWVTYVAFSPDGSRLAAGGSKNREQSAIVIVDVVSGQELARQKMSRRVDLVTWAPDGRLLALRSLAAMVEVRRATDLALTTSVPDRDALYGRFLGDGKRLLLAGQFGRTRLWDVARSRILLEAEEEGRPGSWFTANPVQLWRSFGAGPASIMTLSESPVLGMGDSEEDITSVSQFGGVGLATDARSLVVGGRGRSTLYDSISGRAIAHLHEGEGSESTTARIDETGSAIWLAMSASGLWRQPIHHPAAGEWSTSLAPERIDDERGFFCADLNAASHQLALVRPSDGTVKIVDVTTRTVVARWTHVGAANAVFSPDGTWLAVNSQLAGQPAATVHVTKDGATVRVLGADAGTHVAWSRDGRWIYAAESNGRGALWTTANWKRGPELLTGDKDQIRAGAFSPDGKILAVVDAFLGIRLIDVRSGQDLVALNAPETLGLVAGLGFLSQDRLCVVGSEGRIHTWDLTALQSELGKLGLGWNESH
jgi:WD40 repeat protein